MAFRLFQVTSCNEGVESPTSLYNGASDSSGAYVADARLASSGVIGHRMQEVWSLAPLAANSDLHRPLVDEVDKVSGGRAPRVGSLPKLMVRVHPSGQTGG